MHLQFSHANGFPAGSYAALFAALRARLPDATVDAVERIGHDPRYPITDRWPHLVTELLARIGTRDDVVLVGHSLGGYLSLMAAYRLGSRARAVVLLDSPLIPPWKARVFALMKRTGLDERWSPARFAKRRRDRWPSREDALAHFAGKPLFAAFDRDALGAYVDAGLETHDDGVALAFEREREYRIYRTLPHHLHALTRRPAPCPIGFVGGTRSAELRLTGAAATHRVVDPHFRTIEGGHLFPMERPDETASVVVGLLGAMTVG